MDHSVDLPTQIISEVARLTGTPEADLPALYDAVEIDALAALFDHAETHESADVAVQFSYAGCSVTIDATESVTVRESPDSSVREY